MKSHRTPEDDLARWLDFAGSRQLTFAKTYAATAPRDYIVQDRSPGVSHDDVLRAAHVIHTFGVPGKYYGLTKIYLTSLAGRTDQTICSVICSTALLKGVHAARRAAEARSRAMGSPGRHEMTRTAGGMSGAAKLRKPVGPF